MTIVVRGKMWLIVKEYQTYYLCLDNKGIRECFCKYGRN